MVVRTRGIVACVFGWVVWAAAGAAAATHVTRNERLEAIRHARVWSATNVRSMDIRRGPQGPFAFQPGETVTCEFAPKAHGAGSTRKFECLLPSRRALKVLRQR
jgi:hypothetical protein